MVIKIKSSAIQLSLFAMTVMQLSVVGESLIGTAGKFLFLGIGIIILNLHLLFCLKYIPVLKLTKFIVLVFLLVLPMELIIIFFQPEMATLKNYIFRLVCYNIILLGYIYSFLPIGSKTGVDYIVDRMLPFLTIILSFAYMAVIDRVAASSVGRITASEDISPVGIAFSFCLVGSLSLSLFFSSKSKKTQFIHGLGFLSCLPPVIVSGSRGALLSLFLVFVLYYFYEVFQSRSNRYRKIIMFLAPFLLGSFAIYYISSNPLLSGQLELLIGRILGLSTASSDVSSVARYNIISQYFIDFGNMVLFGYEGYAGVYPHNLFLDFFVRYGIYGAILAIIVYILSFYIIINYKVCLSNKYTGALFSVFLFTFLNAQTSLTIEFIRFYWFSIFFLTFYMQSKKS